MEDLFVSQERVLSRDLQFLVYTFPSPPIYPSLRKGVISRAIEVERIDGLSDSRVRPKEP